MITTKTFVRSVLDEIKPNLRSFQNINWFSGVAMTLVANAIKVHERLMMSDEPQEIVLHVRALARATAVTLLTYEYNNTAHTLGNWDENISHAVAELMVIEVDDTTVNNLERIVPVADMLARYFNTRYALTRGSIIRLYQANLKSALSLSTEAEPITIEDILK